MIYVGNSLQFSHIYLRNESDFTLYLNRKYFQLMKSFDCKLILLRCENPICNHEFDDLVLRKYLLKSVFPSDEKNEGKIVSWYYLDVKTQSKDYVLMIVRH